MSVKSDFVLGKVGVTTTENKGHAPEHIKQQALAFQNQVYTVILHSMKNAIKSQNTTYANLLEKQGHSDMAKILKEL